MKIKIISSGLAMAIGVGIGLLSPQSAFAEKLPAATQVGEIAPILTLSAEEEERLIDETARGLEIMFTQAATMDRKANITSVNMDALKEGLRDAGLSVPYGSSRDWNSFGWCIARKIGISDAKEVARIIFEPQVREYLKSKAWRKAAAIIVNKIKSFAGKKGASWAVKKLAAKALPGGLIGEIVVGISWCGGKEAWNWWRS